LARYAQIVGWGMYAPSEILTNDDLANMVDTSDDWIRARTGIVERRIAPPKETTSTMAIRAARAALRVANANPARLDLIIVATATPDYSFPATACLVQDALGATRAGAFDLSAGCTGFVYGLAVGSQMIVSGAYDQVLVIGAETLSRIINWADRNTCVLFGDGAGAVLLQASDVAGGVLSAVLGADGSGGDLLMLPAGGSRQPASVETVGQGLHYIHMNGPEVFRFATRVTARAARQALAEANVNLEDISLFISHQANGRIIQSATKSLKLPPEKVFVNLDRYGNTSAASVPIALCEAIEQGRVKYGDHLVMVSFGAGLTWAAVVVRWGMPLPVPRPSRWRVAWRLARYLWTTIRSSLRRLGWKILSALRGLFVRDNGSG
jgi:3-oxoacyl-[acyl-carrier-protein] synthase-3